MTAQAPQPCPPGRIPALPSPAPASKALILTAGDKIGGRIVDDAVTHPQHYTFGQYEVLDILMDWFADDPLLWQVGKYIARAKHKGCELEDLLKARFYLDKRIQKLEELRG
jgi:hypothetical protein